MNGISIGFEPENGVFVSSQFEKELVMNDDEQKIAEHFIAAIRAAAPAALLSLERRSADYISLCVGANDFLRFKYTPRARWLSIDTIGLCVSPDDPRFAVQRNKNQRFWKAKIESVSDLSVFDDLVIASCSRNLNQ